MRATNASNPINVRAIFETELAKFEPKMLGFPWESKTAYAGWVSQTYYFARETVTLLSLGAAKSERNSKLQLRFVAHAAEEKGHEKLLEMDMKTLGYDFADYPEMPATSSLYQAQYFWLEQRDPRAFFGYIIFLEGIGALYGQKLHQKTKPLYGASGTYFLKVHAEDDIDHLEKAIDEVSKFEPEVLELVLQNFRHAAACYEWMLKSIVDVHVGKNRAA